MKGEERHPVEQGCSGDTPRPCTLTAPRQDGSSPETHHNLSLHRVGVFKPNSEAVTKCHLH